MKEIKVIINDNRCIAMKLFDKEEELFLRNKLRQFVRMFEDEIRKQIGLPTIFEEMSAKAQNAIKESVKNE